MLPLLNLKAPTPGRFCAARREPATSLVCQIADIELDRASPTDAPMKRPAPGTDKLPDFFTVSKLGAATGQLIRGVSKDEQDLARISDEAVMAVAGVQLLVVEGFCPALKASFGKEKSFSGRDNLLAEIRRDTWIVQLSKHMGVSADLAQQYIDSAEGELATRTHVLGSETNDHSGAEPWISNGGAGVPCKFRIVSMGAWARLDENGEVVETQLQRWCNQGVSVTGGQIFAALKQVQAEFDGSGPGQWCMTGNKWVLAGRSGPAPEDGRAANVDCCSIMGLGRPVRYNLDAGHGDPWRVILPESGPQGQLRVDNTDYLEWLKGVLAVQAKTGDKTAEAAASEASRAVDFYKTLSAGPLKSAFQKIARFRAESVELPDGTAIPATVAAMAALGICFTNRGDEFIPDLSLFVRGSTAALKRLGVVMVEDAWPNGKKTASVLASVLAASLATVRLPYWSPPLELVRVALCAMGACVHSNRVIAWRTGAIPEAGGSIDTSSEDHVPHIKLAADFLRTLRSFEGDMKMLDDVAGVKRSNETIIGKMPISRTSKHTSGQPHKSVPWYHMIDQHVYRGVGFACWDMEADESNPSWNEPFAPRHGQIFGKVTGFNPRLGNKLINEDDPAVKQVRFAQQLVGKFVTSEVGIDVAQEDHVETKLRPSLDPGVMSGGAELITCKVKTTSDEDANDDLGLTRGTTWNLQVILGIATSEEQVLNAPMGRRSLEDTGPAPTDTAIRRAVEAVQSKQAGYDFKSPMLPGYNRVGYVVGKGWTVRGPGKEDIVWKYADEQSGEKNETTLHIREIAAPDWMTEDLHTAMHEKLQDDALALEATLVRDSSRSVVRKGWDGALGHIVHHLSSQQRQRLLATIRGQYSTMRMAVPSLAGGAPSDGPAPSPGDWKIYRALLLISYLCPGALTPKMVPNFTVNNALLLREIEAIIAAAVTATPVQAVASEWVPLRDKASASFSERAADYPYQRPLIDLMLSRDEGAVVPTSAHFLRLRVAAGKTVLGLWYALEYAARSGAADRILWLTVKEAQGDHKKQFETFGFGHLVHVWDPPQEKDKEPWDPPKPHKKIVMIPHDAFSAHKGSRAITELMRWAMEAAPTAVIVVDEVHKLFATGTAKGANVRRLVELAPRSVYATAIPPIKTKSTLLAPYWLRDAVSFPTRVETVACASLVVAAIKPPYESKTTYEGFDMSPEQRAEWISALQLVEAQKQMATKPPGPSAWARLHDLATSFCEQPLIEMAVDYARRDRSFLLDDGTRPFATGGCAVCAGTPKAARDLASKIAAYVASTQGEKFKVIAREDATHDGNAEVGISVINFSQPAGFNLWRYGYWLSTPHPSSMATRIQLRGRIDRLAKQIHQKETNGGELRYTWLYPKKTLLENLLINHSGADTAAGKLDKLAETYASNFK